MVVESYQVQHLFTKAYAFIVSDVIYGCDMFAHSDLMHMNVHLQQFQLENRALDDEDWKSQIKLCSVKPQSSETGDPGKD